MHRTLRVLPYAVAMRHLQSLTPLRGLAAMTVLLYHLITGPADTSLPAFIGRGYLGVDLFFVLSGFVLAHVYLRDFLSEVSPHSVAGFLWVRFARTYPVHFFILLILVPLSGAVHMPAITVIGNFLLMQVPWPIETINTPSWSLSAEWWAYLMFPFAIGWLWRCKPSWAAALAFALLVALDLLIVGVFGELRGIGFGWGALARALPEFTVGVIAYRALSDEGLARFWRSDAAFLAVAGALVGTLEFVPSDGIAVALFPLLLLAAVSNQGVAARLLNAAPLRWLGDISYSLYLGQVFAVSMALGIAQTAAGAALGLDGIRAVTVALAIGIAALLYRCVEVPCRSLLRAAPARLREIAARA
jgi:peptidoglycan/LPS O-acetylase OafA/YrhL